MTSDYVAQAHVTHRYAATPEAVFDAWLDPAIVSKWLFASAGRALKQAKIEARAGGGFHLIAEQGGEDVDYIGTYVALERPHRLVFTLHAPKFSPNTTLVTIEIVAHKSGCELRLLAELTPDLAKVKSDLENGWRVLFELLDDVLVAK